MHESHEGGCLCGSIRYQVATKPLRVTICHCTFCQRMTGSAFLVEPIFRRDDVTLTGEAPKTYDHRSDGSGMRVTVNFCGRCGTALYLSFARFEGFIGLCAGTFDDPNWFDRGPAACRHIFTDSAQSGVVLPAGIQTHGQHAIQLDGTPNKSTVFAEPRAIDRGR